MFPHIFQHWLTARSAETFRLTLVAHPLFIMITWVPCILIGIWATGATLNGAPIVPAGANPNAVLGLMVGKLTNPFLAGLVAAGVLAAIMSSLDSQFVCMGTLFTEDLVVHHFGEERFTDIQKVWMARSFIVAIVVLTYLLSLKNPLQIFALGVWCFTGFAALFPIAVASIYWKRATKVGSISAILVTAVFWLFFFQQSDFGQNRAYLIGNAMPVTFVILPCVLTLIVVSLCTRPPSPDTLRKFFDH